MQNAKTIVKRWGSYDHFWQRSTGLHSWRQVHIAHIAHIERMPWPTSTSKLLKTPLIKLRHDNNQNNQNKSNDFMSHFYSFLNENDDSI